MIEKIKSGLGYAPDFYRTAPLGETIFLMSAGQIPLTYDDPLILGASILISLYGVALTAKQFRLRRRLEKSVSKHGYIDKVFETTNKKWCDRQTAIVVTKNCGNLDDYIALCESNKGKISFPSLGHF